MPSQPDSLSNMPSADLPLPDMRSFPSPTAAASLAPVPSPPPLPITQLGEQLPSEAPAEPIIMPPAPTATSLDVSASTAELLARVGVADTGSSWHQARSHVLNTIV